MVDRIGLSYYADWHGTYEMFQKFLVDISRAFPGVKMNIAENSPKSRARSPTRSGTRTTRSASRTRSRARATTRSTS